MMTESLLKSYAARLSARIELLQAEDDGEQDARKPVALDQQSVGRLSRMDAMRHQALAKASSQRKGFEIIKAKAALIRITDDEFGYCSDCGEIIDQARLEFDPAIALCITCARG